ncbi:DICT sensory domain-containing protein [Salinirubrum litoreum]|uniref:DICT sensory domain-containing protein n=1 Tax=Salinirubrum litoreum TaxID=1126234 RepID=A0ABD5R9M0_9EURY|nr:DICT sensory domain-containing protein [Salinirubrum litoreum]
MSLRSVIDGVEGSEKTLTVYDADDALLAELREYFGSQQVIVEEGTAVGGPVGFATLSVGDRLLTAIDLDDLSTPLGGGRDLNPAFQTLLGHLDGTTFSSYDTGQMVATSREIEDRAWRAGTGQLHAGFQYFTALATQQSVYTDLAERDLDIHVYAAPDGTEVDLPGVTVHAESVSEITDTWFVAFDGGDTPSDKCALLAEERHPDAYYGFWTYDPDIVDDILAHLTEQYPTVV